MKVTVISIPCGAIRSSCAFLFSDCILISIPCGAIRSSGQISVFYQPSEFQFLVVRLEEHINDIIILFSEFQFLVVRLEVNISMTSSYFLANFNSLWCD